VATSQKGDLAMIVVGIDPHKQTHTAAAVERATGELIGELTVSASPEGAERLLAWAAALQPAPLFALEDCRHVSRSLESFLLARGQQLVRVPPKLMAAHRRCGRCRGKSDAIDALAVARAALREPLPAARPAPLARELKLLVDHREDLIGERTRLQTRLRWHLHELELGADVPLRALDRPLWQRRLARQLARREPTTLVLIAREQLRRIVELTRRANELECELAQLVRREASPLLELPGCGVLTAAKLVAETDQISRFPNDAALASHAGVAPLSASSGKQQRHRLNRSGNRQLNCALHRIAITQARTHEPARRYLERKRTEGKSRREALRCLKRHLTRAVYHALLEIHTTSPLTDT
jgi:transposase